MPHYLVFCEINGLNQKSKLLFKVVDQFRGEIFIDLIKVFFFGWWQEGHQQLLFLFSDLLHPPPTIFFAKLKNKEAVFDGDASKQSWQRKQNIDGHQRKEKKAAASKRFKCFFFLSWLLKTLGHLLSGGRTFYLSYHDSVLQLCQFLTHKPAPSRY